MKKIMKTITIFTPTYNRKKNLKKLYSSLLNQKQKDNFTWLIVDDGSTDGTKKLIDELLLEDKIDIKYFYQKNSGKQIAHNLGVEKANTDLFICVDSDDYLLPEATEIIEKCLDDEDEKVAGWIFMRGNLDGNPIGTQLTKRMMTNVKKLTELYEKYSFKGDTALVFKTDILKKYKFDTVNNEKFIGEDYLYRKLEQDYDLVPRNKIFYITEYQSDGYTKNVLKHITSSPGNYLLLKRISIETSNRLMYKFKHAILFDAMAIYMDNYKVIFKDSYIYMKVLAIPLGYVYYFMKFRRLK